MCIYIAILISIQYLYYEVNVSCNNNTTKTFDLQLIINKRHRCFFSINISMTHTHHIADSPISHNHSKQLRCLLLNSNKLKIAANIATTIVSIIIRTIAYNMRTFLQHILSTLLHNSTAAPHEVTLIIMRSADYDDIFRCCFYLTTCSIYKRCPCC